MLETCLRQSTCWWRSSLGVGGGRQRDKQCRSLVQTSSCCPTVTRTAPDNYHLKSSCRQLPSLEPLWTRQASLPHHQPTRQAATNQTPPDIYKHRTIAETRQSIKELLPSGHKRQSAPCPLCQEVQENLFLSGNNTHQEKKFLPSTETQRTVLVSVCFWGIWES